VASSDSTVLIDGENGTGKELIAHAIHNTSQRCGRAFIQLNCAAIPSVAMRTELAAELPKIMVDRVQLQQVLMNLMLNAIEAMREEGGELTVKSQLQDGQLQFSVSDTGVGLPTEKLDQIFSAFFTTKPEGSGMGLAISRSIVESHGGRLWATANDGRGATFYFTLATQTTETSSQISLETLE
jgi:signal transduction histidine kinase